jgi:predicted HicB family RNase H-like nuclease
MTDRAQLNVTIDPRDAQAIRENAKRDGVSLASLIVRSVLGREPYCPTCGQPVQPTNGGSP